jgi:hypothetical protein
VADANTDTLGLGLRADCLGTFGQQARR